MQFFALKNDIYFDSQKMIWYEDEPLLKVCMGWSYMFPSFSTYLGYKNHPSSRVPANTPPYESYEKLNHLLSLKKLHFSLCEHSVNREIKPSEALNKQFPRIDPVWKRVFNLII